MRIRKEGSINWQDSQFRWAKAHPQGKGRKPAVNPSLSASCKEEEKFKV